VFSVALSPGRPESLLATILPFGVRTFLLSPLAGRRGDRLAHSGRYLYTILLELFVQVRPRRVDLPGRLSEDESRRGFSAENVCFRWSILQSTTAILERTVFL